MFVAVDGNDSICGHGETQAAAWENAKARYPKGERFISHPCSKQLYEFLMGYDKLPDHYRGSFDYDVIEKDAKKFFALKNNEPPPEGWLDYTP